MANSLSTQRVEVADRVVGRDGLTRRMRAASFALAQTLFTGDAGPPPAARLDWLCDDLDDFLAQAGARARLVYRACLLAISALAPLFILRPAPFRWLSIRTRARALARMERSPLGLAVFGAKAVLCILYYEHPDAARYIGHDASCLLDGEAGASGGTQDAVGSPRQPRTPAGETP